MYRPEYSTWAISSSQMFFPPYLINFFFNRIKETDSKGLASLALSMAKNYKILPVIQHYVNKEYNFGSISLLC